MACAVFVLILVAAARRRDRALRRIQRNLPAVRAHHRQGEEAGREVARGEAPGRRRRRRSAAWRRGSSSTAPRHELSGYSCRASKHRPPVPELRPRRVARTGHRRLGGVGRSALAGGVARHFVGCRSASADHRETRWTPIDRMARHQRTRAPGSTHTAIKHAKNVVTVVVDGDARRRAQQDRRADQRSNKEPKAKTEAAQAGEAPRFRPSAKPAWQRPSKEPSQSALMPTIFSPPELSGGRGLRSVGAIAVEPDSPIRPARAAPAAARALGGQTQMVGITEEH